LAVVLVVAAVIPPIGVAARRYDWAEALQFMLLMLVCPGLFVAGAPWSRIGLAPSAASLAESRRRHPELIRAVVIVGLALSCAVAWRTPAAVDSLHALSWPLAVEVVSLTLSGTALWLELISSPPLAPRSTRPVRIALCALSMWTIWLLAYMVAMSPNPWYRSYQHTAHHGLSLSADQQLAAGVLWAGAAGCFVPIIFWNLLQWLRSEENPDEELHRLVRQERRRAAPPH
jgi:cytochrome c oxidase assembly factor CtaG